ncbi:MAG: SsrA-binding protein SmpB [Patescibacteria group bacterium]
MSNKNKIILKNKEAAFSYELIDSFEAGLVLSGPEVKSVKNGRVSLKGSYISIDQSSEAWLVGAHIAPYLPAKGNQADYEPDRRRKLLLNKKEIHSLLGKGKQKGLTIIPLSVYTKRGLIKVEIALARGKSKVDKRETIKKREAQREIRRAMKV